MKVLRVISGGPSGKVGHALVDGKVLCGGLRMFYFDPKDAFNRTYDCKRCLRSLRRLEAALAAAPELRSYDKL